MIAEVKASRFRFSLGRMASRFEAAVAGGLQDATERAVKEAKSTTAWKDQTGKTRESIRAKRFGAFHTAVVARGASSVLNSGSGLYGPRGSKYMIAARNAKALRFVWHGEVVFRRYVMHPGVKPTHFLDKARDNSMAFVREVLVMRVAEVTR